MNMEKNLNSANVYNLIILDESGSMRSIYSESLAAINEAIKGIRSNQSEFPQQRQFVSIVTFAGRGMDGMKVRRDRVPVMRVRDMTVQDYRPGGGTPLYDTMGQAITALSEVICEGDPVFVTIITDGYENTSEEYSGSAIKELVARKRRDGWTFAYIGANQDAVEVASELNIPKSNSINWACDAEGVANMSMQFIQAGANFSRKVQRRLDAGAPMAAASFEDLFDDKDNK